MPQEEEKRVNRQTGSLFICGLAGPIRVDFGSGIGRRKEADKQRFPVDLLQAVVDFGEEVFGNVVRQDNFAIGLVAGHGGGGVCLCGLRGGRSDGRKERRTHGQEGTSEGRRNVGKRGDHASHYFFNVDPNCYINESMAGAGHVRCSCKLSPPGLKCRGRSSIKYHFALLLFRTFFLGPTLSDIGWPISTPRHGFVIALPLASLPVRGGTLLCCGTSTPSMRVNVV